MRVNRGAFGLTASASWSSRPWRIGSVIVGTATVVSMLIGAAIWVGWTPFTG
ncbi:hypothetical protein KIK06_28970 [Nocardiopsis sp. EMB25]|uniref:hypothetical protein n=1 Tax=Nocardiopsis sp. EMB25 TaxID=2835867 RepID=UPI002283366A|nr:hypothetical protein [Nocardiopsis sp. EMB25]MCY9787916.1 hypothetical protein [Nocardiopsis sp. EMB25]